MPQSATHLVISAVGSDRPGIANRLSQRVFDAQLNILDSRMALLGGEFAILMLVEGSAEAVAALAEALPQEQEALGLTVQCRTTAPAALNAGRPYRIEVIALDHPGIVASLTRFLSERGINIHQLDTQSYHAPHTGARLFTTTLVVNLPKEVASAKLREQFLDHCDQLNLDATFEAVR